MSCKTKLVAGTMVFSLCIAIPTGVMAKKKLVWWVPGEQYWKMMETAFEKKHPDVDVSIVNGDMDKFYTMVTAGLMPDIWGPWGTPGIQANVNRNWALDLSPYIKQDSKEMNIQDFFPGLMRQFTVQGRVYSMPTYMNIDYFFLNTAQWAESGLALPPMDSSDKDWNWDRMVECAMKTSRKDAAGRVNKGGIYTDFTWGDHVPNIFTMFGAQVYSQDTFRTSVPQQIHLNTPEVVTALTKGWELRWKYNVYNTDFTGGRTAASIEHGFVIYNIVKAKKLKWAIRNLPWGKTNSGTLYPAGWCISKVTKNKNLAWEFVKFLASPEAMRVGGTDSRSHIQFSAPARKSVFLDTLGKNIGNATGMKPDDVYRIAGQADNAGVVKYQETVCLHMDMAKFMAPIFTDIMNNKISPKEGAVRLQDTADRRLPEMFKRWMRNIKFTGADKEYKPGKVQDPKGNLM